jgi:site-specific DNA-methyltransferase (adenine-specific)
MPQFIRRLHYGDNLQVLKDFPPESVDLIYLDPPFNSKRQYNISFGGEAQTAAFVDTWAWNAGTADELKSLQEMGLATLDTLLHGFREVAGDGTGAYLVMMSARIVELKRVLKPTGSIYLHCDSTASHYLKMIMDTVFGKDNFRNEVIWKRTFACNRARRWGPVHDNLLLYSKSGDYVWNPVYAEYSSDYIRRNFKYTASDGRLFQAVALTAPGTRKGASGKPWRGVDPSLNKRYWFIPRGHLQGHDIPDNSQDALDYLDSIGRVYWPQRARCRGS